MSIPGKYLNIHGIEGPYVVKVELNFFETTATLFHGDGSITTHKLHTSELHTLKGNYTGCYEVFGRIGGIQTKIDAPEPEQQRAGVPTA